MTRCSGILQPERRCGFAPGGTTVKRFMLGLTALAAVAPCAAWAQEASPTVEPAPAPPAAVEQTAEPPPAAPAAPAAPAPDNRPAIVWTTRNPAGFVAMTPGKAAFGVAGSMAMIGAGDLIVKENLMTEPAGPLSRDLARVVAERTGGVVRAEPAPATALKPEEIAQGAAGARYVVDVTTLGWNFMYQPFKWTSFNANYAARLQVIDATNGKLLLKHQCLWPKKGQAEFTSQDGLLADQARLLKQQIMKATLVCRSEFLSKMDTLQF